MSGEDRAVFIRYHKCECFGNIIDWLNGGMKDDISAYFHRIYQLKRGWEGEVLRREALGCGQRSWKSGAASWFMAGPMPFRHGAFVRHRASAPWGTAFSVSLQWKLVFCSRGSQTHSTAGMRKMLTRAEMRAPRASMVQMELMISISEMSPTPRVAQNMTRELVMMEPSEAAATAWMASVRSLPERSSSRKRVASRMA